MDKEGSNSSSEHYINNNVCIVIFYFLSIENITNQKVHFDIDIAISIPKISIIISNLKNTWSRITSSGHLGSALVRFHCDLVPA